MRSVDAMPENVIAPDCQSRVGTSRRVMPNPAATSRLDRDENDTELRTRARRFLVGAERGTRSALESAIAAEGVRAEVTEPEPGLVQVLLHGGAMDPTRPP